MRVELSDAQIEALVAERKILPADVLKLLGRRSSRLSHERAEVDFKGESGGRFRLLIRQNMLNRLDFSAIFAYLLPQTTRLFRLRRYNGNSHWHTNKIEGASFKDFHIHIATERYQRLGAREDAYAERTERFGTLDQALRCLLGDVHCQPSEDPDQTGLFGADHGTV